MSPLIGRALKLIFRLRMNLLPYSFPLSVFARKRTWEEKPLECLRISFMAPNCNIIKMFSSTQGSPDLLDNPNKVK